MKLVHLRLLVIQELFDGPWRWCIVDDKNRIVAKSPEEFQYPGWAFKHLASFVRAFNPGPPPTIEFRPAVQLSLFKNEKVTV